MLMIQREAQDEPMTNVILNSVRKTALENPGAPIHRMAGAREVTYGQAWDMAGRIAGKLREKTSGREPVMVYGHKSSLMVVSFLACLRAGHAFVPIDSELPSSRVVDIARQLDFPPIICAEQAPCDLLEAMPANRFLSAADAANEDGFVEDEPEDLWVSGEETHYIIFTSGSTGVPKGIEITANNIERFAAWMKTFPVVREGGAVFLDQAPYSFDLSEYQVVGALVTGGCLHAVSAETTHDYGLLFSDLRGSQVDVWISTPSFADMCLVDPSFSQDILPHARLFLFCGETLHHRTARALRQRFDRALVVNTYGPTESTVAVTYAEIGEADLNSEDPLTVGSARPGTELRIIDPETGERKPAGESGEIVIVGDTVAKGYYRSPDKTAAAFFAAHLSDETPVRGYRTGDQGSLDERGNLRFEGRLDHLVKMNGFRIELGDIECNLMSLEGVEQAAVIPVIRNDQIRSLKAFVVMNSACELDGLELAQDLKARLAGRIPAYMVPRAVCRLQSMPLTPNAKIDRRALAAMGR